MIHIRITPELLDIMRRVGEMHGLSVSAIVHKAIYGLMALPPTLMLAQYRKRAGISIGDEPHLYAPQITKAGPVQLQVRGRFPDILTFSSNDLREKIYDKCVYALSRPRREEYRTTLREGVDYIVRSEG